MTARIWLRSLLPVLLLIVLPCVTHLSLLMGWQSVDPLVLTARAGWSASFVGHPWLDPNIGYQAQALGKYAADEWLHGRVPWWNPYNGVGLPLIGEMQPAAMFLPFVLLYHFESGFLWNEILVQIIAGICTFYFFRHLRLRMWICLWAAFLFELNGVYAWLGAPIMTPVCFLPMLLWAFEAQRSRVQEGGRQSFAAIALAVAASIYAGFPEVAYIDGLFVSAWVLLRLRGLERGQQRRVALTIVCGVIAGLMLAVPQIWPFAEYLSLSYIGEHSDASAHYALSPGSLPLTFIPGMYGRLTALMDPQDYVGWGHIGGYIPALQILLAIFFVRMIPRGVAVLWIAWSVACLVKMFDLRPLSDLINLLPLLKFAAVYRYCQASMAFASICVLAMGVEAYCANVRPRRGWMLCALLSWLLVLAIMLLKTMQAWLAAQRIGGVDSAISVASIAWSLVACVLVSAILMSPGGARRSIYWVTALVLIDAAASFLLPLGSAGTEVAELGHGRQFVQSHLGLQRISSQNVLKPNYGAYFQLAQVQHNYLPIYRPWVDYVQSQLQSDADKIAFTGVPAHGLDQTNLVMALSDNLDAYRALGVRFMLFGAGSRAFDFDAYSKDPRYRRPMEISAYYVARTQWTFNVQGRSWVLHDIALGIKRSSDAVGYLRFQLCAATCVTREVRVQDQVPDQLTHVDVPVGLSLGGGHPAQVNAYFEYRSTAGTVALDFDKGSSVPASGFPAIEFHLVDPRVSNVYSGSDMVIYQVSDPKPYFEAQGADCRLRISTRDSLSSDCSAPGRLLRREAYYPGWRALVDDHAQALTQVAPLFQGIELPEGHHQIRFVYRPSGYWLFMSIFGLGLLWCVADLLAGSVRRTTMVA